jgi:hypothetical protein
MGAGMTATTELRAKLYASLALSPLLPDGRVHRHSPATLAAPTVYVGDVTQFPRTDDGFRETLFQFEVVAVVDGADVAQRDALDVYADAIVDAAVAAGFALAARRAMTLDVGGPTLRAVAVFVEHPYAAPTLCPPAALNGVTANV